MKNNFHNVLKELRTENKKTQTEVARELNITQRAYSHYETGESEPSLDLLIDFAEYYKIPVDILIGRYELRKNIQKTEKPFRVQIARTYDGTSRRGTVTDEEMQKINELPDATDF